MRGRVLIAFLLLICAIPLGTFAETESRAIPSCNQKDLAEISSQELILDGDCLKIDLGTRSPGSILSFDVVVSQGNLDALLFNSQSIIPYENGDGYRNAFEENASFEEAFGEYEFDWMVPFSGQPKNWFLVLDNLEHNNDFEFGGQGGADARAAVEISGDSLDYLTLFRDVIKLNSGESETLASMSLDEGSILQISMDAIQGESDLYLQTSTQVGTQEFISNTRIFDAESSVVNWDVSQQYAQETLYLIADNGDENTVFRGTIELKATPVVSADFTISQSSNVNIGQTITFDASLSPNGNGQISEYRWDVFDDGTIDATGMKYDFSFQDTGVFDVTLTVVSQIGSVDSRTIQLTVIDQENPVAVIQGNGAQLTDLSWLLSPSKSITFNASASQDNDQIQSYAWTVDGQPYANAPSITLSWDNIGAHVIALNVTDQSGNVGSTMTMLSVLDTNAPIIDESLMTKVREVLQGDMVSFNAQASDVFDDDSALIYSWDLSVSVDTNGDGNAENDGDLVGKSVTYEFVNPGRYDVVLTVSDPSGLSDSYAFEIVVSEDSGFGFGVGIVFVIVLVSVLTAGIGLFGNRAAQRKQAIQLLLDHGFTPDEAANRIKKNIAARSLPLWAKADVLAGFDLGNVKTDAQLMIETKEKELQAIYGSDGVSTQDPHAGFRPQVTRAQSSLVSGEALEDLMGESKPVKKEVAPKSDEFSTLLGEINSSKSSTSKANQHVQSGGISVPDFQQKQTEMATNSDDVSVQGTCTLCGESYQINLPSQLNEALVDCPHCGEENHFRR
tara:strand:+ start:356 stop:2719 length:2364 start_codon:yes stop_codon:yes gene_type:complete